MWRYILLEIFLVAFKTVAGNLKIDFSCHAEMATEQWNLLKDECRQKTGNPLKRPCIEACILQDLGLLQIAYTEGKVKRINVDGTGTTFVQMELEALLSDNQDLAEAVYEKVEEKCGELMRRTIHVDKKCCEDWDELYNCTQKAICKAKIQALGEMFPDLRCHPGYKRGPAREDHEQCIKDIENPLNRGCYKLCMLQRFQMFEYKMDDNGQLCPRLGDIGTETDGYIGGLTSELQWRLKGNAELSIKIAKEIHAKCKSKLDQLVAEKKSCEKWDPFYDCVKEAVSCKS